MKYIKCSILLIGTELLNGKVTDLNASFVINILKDTNINISNIITINDEVNKIHRTLEFLAKESDIIIISGGLGPTNDDITKIGISKFLNKKLIYDKNLYHKLKQKNKAFKKYINENYATLPESCDTLNNEIGLAPGIVCKFGDKKFLYALPGIPTEFKIMFKNYVLEDIKRHFFIKNNKKFLIRTSNIGESSLADLIKELILKYNIKENQIGYYPETWGVDLILYELPEKNFLKELKELLKKYIYCINKEITLPEILKEILIKENYTLATAESCTGGFLSKIITDIPGASDFFKGGIISYSNELKQKILNVNPDTLKKFGAVSAQTVGEMLKGLLNITNADYGIAISGIAGPTGGTPEKPVGTVYIAYGNKENFKTEKIFGGINRDMIRQRSAYNSIFKLLKTIKGDDFIYGND